MLRLLLVVFRWSLDWQELGLWWVGIFAIIIVMRYEILT